MQRRGITSVKTNCSKMSRAFDKVRQPAKLNTAMVLRNNLKLFQRCAIVNLTLFDSY